MGDDKKCSCMMHIIIALIVGFLLGGLIVYLFKTNDLSISMTTTTQPTKNGNSNTTKKEEEIVDDNEEDEDGDEVEGFKNILREKSKSTNLKKKTKKRKISQKKKSKKLVWKGNQKKKQPKTKMGCNCDA